MNEPMKAAINLQVIEATLENMERLLEQGEYEAAYAMGELAGSLYVFGETIAQQEGIQRMRAARERALALQRAKNEQAIRDRSAQAEKARRARETQAETDKRLADEALLKMLHSPESDEVAEDQRKAAARTILQTLAKEKSDRLGELLPTEYRTFVNDLCFGAEYALTTKKGKRKVLARWEWSAEISVEHAVLVLSDTSMLDLVEDPAKLDEAPGLGARPVDADAARGARSL
jgi:hypothetical protein